MTENQKKQQLKGDVQYVAISSNMLQPRGSEEEELDLIELWNAIVRGKWMIFSLTMLFAILSLFYALSLPNIYKSEALLAPAQSQQQGGMGGLASQFGGLASLAGVKIGTGGFDKTALAIEVLKSRGFFSQFLENHGILPDLMAAVDWSRSTNSLVYDDEVYIADSDEWIREAKFPKLPEPSMQEAKKEFDKLFKVAQSDDTGMIIISMEHLSPYIAKQWLDWLIEDINSVMKARDKEEAELSIKYLQSQITNTNIVEQKTLLYELIEEQAKTLMFAEVREEYVFKTIDPAMVPESKFKPKRTLIVVLGVMLGAILSLIFVLARYFSERFKAAT